MLTEGWDANTVTHILGVRAFGSQLLCEQVVGRGLRRRSYAVNDEGRFEPEYANVYGIPFQFIASDKPTEGPAAAEAGDRGPRRCRAASDLRIDVPEARRLPRRAPRRGHLARPRRRARFEIGPDTVPTWVEIGGVVGKRELEEDDPTHTARSRSLSRSPSASSTPLRSRHDVDDGEADRDHGSSRAWSSCAGSGSSERSSSTAATASAT